MLLRRFSSSYTHLVLATQRGPDSRHLLSAVTWPLPAGDRVPCDVADVLRAPSCYADQMPI